VRGWSGGQLEHDITGFKGRMGCQLFRLQEIMDGNTYTGGGTKFGVGGCDACMYHACWKGFLSSTANGLTLDMMLAVVIVIEMTYAIRLRGRQLPGTSKCDHQGRRVLATQFNSG